MKIRHGETNQQWKVHSHSTPRPLPHSNARRGRMRILIFSGKGVFFGRSLGKISRENPEQGVFFVVANGNQYPR